MAWTPAVDTTAAFKMLAAAGPLIEQIFYLQDFEDIQFPMAALLYVPDGRRQGNPAPLTNGENQPDPAAERLEFRDKDYPRALAAYRQALERASEPSSKGLILNAIARVQRNPGSSGTPWRHMRISLGNTARSSFRKGSLLVPPHPWKSACSPGSSGTPGSPFRRALDFADR